MHLLNEIDWNFIAQTKGVVTINPANIIIIVNFIELN